MAFERQGRDKILSIPCAEARERAGRFDCYSLSFLLQLLIDTLTTFNCITFNLGAKILSDTTSRISLLCLNKAWKKDYTLIGGSDYTCRGRRCRDLRRKAVLIPPKHCRNCNEGVDDQEWHP